MSLRLATGLMMVIVVMAGAAWLFAAPAADAQLGSLVGDQALEVRCIQTGVEVVKFNVQRIGAHATSEAYVEYMTEDGRQGQFRFGMNMLCMFEALKKPASST